MIYQTDQNITLYNKNVELKASVSRYKNIAIGSGIIDSNGYVHADHLGNYENPSLFINGSKGIIYPAKEVDISDHSIDIDKIADSIFAYKRGEVRLPKNGKAREYYNWLYPKKHYKDPKGNPSHHPVSWMPKDGEPIHSDTTRILNPEPATDIVISATGYSTHYSVRWLLGQREDSLSGLVEIVGGKGNTVAIKWPKNDILQVIDSSATIETLFKCLDKAKDVIIANNQKPYFYKN